MKRPQAKKYLVKSEGPIIDQTPNELLETRSQKYLMVSALSQRARNLTRGDRSLVDLPLPHTMADLALAEVRSDKLKLVQKAASKVLANQVEKK